MCSAASARLSATSMAPRCPARGGAPCWRSNAAVPRHSAVMSSAAATAVINASPTTPAATGTARSVRVLARAQWLEDRQAELLNVPYFHVVFTVPEAVATIAFQNQTVIYDILFRAASETLRTIGADPSIWGAEIGFLAVLHTWGQNLVQNPHS